MQNTDIHLKPSKQFILLIILIVMGGLVIIFSLQCGYWVKALLIIFVLIYGLQIFKSFGLYMGMNAIKGLRQIGDNNWLLLANQREIIGKLTGESTVTSQLCVLRFIIPGERSKLSCIIFKDSLDQEQYRRLLVWLRCNKP